MMHKRKMHKRMRTIGRTGVSLVSATALAFSMGIGSVTQAFAVEALEGEEYVSCSPNPYGHSMPDYLGLNSTDCRSQEPTGDQVLYDKITNDKGALRWLLMGTKEYNENPDTYLYNSIYATGGKTIVLNANRYYGGYGATKPPEGQGVSNAICALTDYKGSDPAVDDDAIWEMKPDIVVGNMTPSGTTDYETIVSDMKLTYADKFGDYDTPVTFDISDLSPSDGCITYMYRLAAAADEVVADSSGTKKIRYQMDFDGDGKSTATDLAMNFEAMARGAEGYILSQLDKDKASKKTVAIVKANDGTNVTLSAKIDGQYTCLKNVANNYVTGSEDKTVTIAELKKAPVDLICVNVGKGVSTTGLDELFGKTYWVTNAYTGSIAAVDKGPGITENFPRVLGCLYPEYIDQSDWVAYLYDTVYHVKSDMIGTAVNRAMDGVRNWDVKAGSGNDYVQWSENTVSDYSRAEVKDRIDYGLAYLKAKSNPTGITDTLLGTVKAQSAVADPAVKYKPNVTNGNKGTWKGGTTTGIAFRSDAPLNEFLHAKVDGKVLAAENYTLKEGSTVVELTPAYLATLPVGNHTIDIVSSRGTASAAFTTTAADPTPATPDTDETQAMLRLYNPNSGEHFYTANVQEKDNVVKAGWKYEGIAWTAPKSSSTPVYRLYSGTDHHYTTDASERDWLVTQGWKYEGISWYSDDAKTAGLYRLFNPNVDPTASFNNSGSHHYTMSSKERDNLVSVGWKYEGIAWHGIK